MVLTAKILPKIPAGAVGTWQKDARAFAIDVWRNMPGDGGMRLTQV